MDDDRPTPYARHRHAVSTLVGQAESYLWPAAVPPERQTKIAASEIVGVYPHRNTIPSDLWDHLLQSASDRLDILVHAGLFLVERPDFIRTVAEKAALHLRKLGAGDLFDTYARSFVDVWTLSKPATW